MPLIAFGHFIDRATNDYGCEVKVGAEGQKFIYRKVAGGGKPIDISGYKRDDVLPEVVLSNFCRSLGIPKKAFDIPEVTYVYPLGIFFLHLKR